ncbi:MAG TPA: hypothetical protein VK184_00530 [Nostocaceae cyanobacterium]|nr:hypothetical protein [Nostocaceae cyanobacterium]
MTIFDQNAIETLNRMAAQKIIEKMRILRMSSTENSKRRWIWELLQNANDKSAIDFPDKRVSILIKLNQDFIEFSHNYSFFTYKNIQGIIRQISSDDKDWGDVDRTELPKTIGRFGTGFLTTHLLSDQVNVRGIFKHENGQYQRLNFPLNRTGREIQPIIASINDSFQTAEEVLQSSPELTNNDLDFNDFNTTFRYELNSQGLSVAEIGLNDLENSLPYTLIFVDKIEYVEIIREGKVVVYEKQEPYYLTNEIKVFKFEKTLNGKIEELHYAYLSKNLTSIVVPISCNEEKISIQLLDKSIPRIFLGFPLIGTEDFSFPAVFNNPFLEPTEPRDGIFITDHEEENILNNKRIIKEAIDLYFILLQYAINENWQNLYLLAKTDLPTEKDWISQDWYKNQVQKVLRATLIKSEIVYTDSPQEPKIKLEDALFPYSKSKTKISTIWEFAKEFLIHRLPKYEHIEFWYEIIDNSWGKNLRYTLKQLVADVSAYSNIKLLADRIDKSENDVLIWLEKLINFVLEEEQELLDNLAIIPNQYGNFKPRKELWEDKNIPEALKDILKTLQEDWRVNLKHPQIKTVNLTIVKAVDDIITRINKIIKENKNPNIHSAVLELISCFPSDNGSSNKNHDFWRFAKDFYPNTPDKKILKNWSDSIWEECHKWFVHKICKDVEQQQNIEKLTAHLEKDALSWLNQFTLFIAKYNFEPCFNDYAILPNQREELKKKKDLSVDYGIDETLKDIFEELGSEIRSCLLATEIELEIEGKICTSKTVAQDITEIVLTILKNEVTGTRQEKNKEIFAKILVWFHENEKLAQEIFGDLYEKRHRLRSDEEIIADIKFRQAILNNKNGYTEEDIIELINIPKEELLLKWKESGQRDKIQEQEIEQEEIDDFINSEDLLTALGIYSLEELENAKHRLTENRYIRVLCNISSNPQEAFLRVMEMIERAKNNVRDYLSKKEEYNCENWYEESITVIAGVKKNDKLIKIVVRPSDGGQVILYYSQEFDALEIPDSELWIDDSRKQENLTLGKILKNTRIYRIPL